MKGVSVSSDELYPQRLAGKVALVTGAARGLGRAFALRLARLGADVVVSDVNMRTAEMVGEELTAASVVEEIGAIGRSALGIEADVTDRSAVENMVSLALGEFGRIDVLVNNAGSSKPVPGQTGPAISFRDAVKFVTILDLPQEGWDGLFLNNIMGTLFCSQAVGRHMRECGSGKIINLASAAGRTPLLTVLAPYCAAKAAVISLTQALALEMAPHGVTVNAIAPGYIGTASWNLSLGQVEDVLIPQIPLGRKGTPEDCAKVIEFLATDLSDYLTGAVIPVDGGLVDLNPFLRPSDL